MSVDDNVRTAKKILNAYNQHDLDHYAEFWADQEEAAARKAFQKDIWLAAFPDTHMEVTSMTAQGNLVVTESIVRATHTGPLETWVSQSVPATNKKIEFPLCNVGEYENGKLKKLRSYGFSPANVLRQLGVIDLADWEQFS
jgi:predicted ester cyclase